jgi:hypothetical protein
VGIAIAMFFEAHDRRTSTHATSRASAKVRIETVEVIDSSVVWPGGGDPRAGHAVLARATGA